MKLITQAFGMILVSILPSSAGLADCPLHAKNGNQVKNVERWKRLYMVFHDILDTYSSIPHRVLTEVNHGLFLLKPHNSLL